MDFEFDSTYVLYSLGALLGVAAAVYFGAEIVLSFAPVVKSSLLFLGFLFFFIAAFRMPRVLNTTLYVLSAASYVVFLGYTISKFEFGTDAVFLSLAASSALFLGLGYLVRERGLAPARRQVRILLIVVLVVAAMISAFDIVGAQPTYTLVATDNVTITDSGDVTVATVTAENRFVLSRELDVPEYGACLYATEKYVPYMYVNNSYERTKPLDSGETRTLDLKIGAPYLSTEEGRKNTVPGTFPVETADRCPETATTEKIVVVENDTWGGFIESNFETPD